MLKLPFISWFNFNELGVSIKDLKVFFNRILGVMVVSLLFSAFESFIISPTFRVLSLIESNFSLIGEKDSLMESNFLADLLTSSNLSVIGSVIGLRDSANFLSCVCFEILFFNLIALCSFVVVLIYVD